MIPKIIHYCWFGNNPLPDKVKKCIESWKKYCPDYEIIRWDESNFDYKKNQYISDAYKNKKWAFVADYARLDVVYQYGGIYLDTDVELIKGIDDLLNDHFFLAIEKYSKMVNTGLGFGAEKKSFELKTLMNVYDTLSFFNGDGTCNLTPCTKYTTDYLAKYGYQYEDKTQRINNIKVYASEVFCPIDFETGKKYITLKTRGIHWYDSTWFTEEDREIYQTERIIKDKFPLLIAKPVCFFYRKSYRLCQYIREGTILKELRRKILR